MSDPWKPLSPSTTPQPAGDAPPTDHQPKHYISKRAHTIWQRMRLWYPNKLPYVVPEDYCKLIDASSKDQLAAVMSNMKTRHVTWPPTFPEFAVLFTEQESQAQSVDWQTILLTIGAKLLKHGLITDQQAQRPFTYHGTGGTPGVALHITSITVPAVGDAPEKTFKLDEWLHR